MRSHWETRLLRRGRVVIGGGIVGLSTALALRRAAPHVPVLVLERGLLPTGATTRSAGFACLGGLGELAADVDAHGLQATVDLVARRHAGLRRLRERLGDDALGFEHTGGAELLQAERAGLLDRLDALDAALRPVVGGPMFRRDDRALPALRFGHTAHLVRLPREGALDPGRLAEALLRACRAADVEVWTGAAVTRLDPGEHGVDLALHDPAVGATRLHAAQVAVCTNALARQLVPGLPVVPGRGQVLLTEPVPGLPWRGVFHRDAGDVYFREVEGRVLLGGARQRDVAGETTDALALADGIQAHLDHLLATVVLPGCPVRVARRWAGVMAFGPARAPLVQRVHPRVAVGVRLGGMGIALGTGVGDEVAALLEG
ncbi:MAG: FAD-binding oxidoreductase [Alphaproteobacteria bacterium]|nr:FAD-binding oxidoreductase [Alphaproteobacteria bacterium]